MGSITENATGDTLAVMVQVLQTHVANRIQAIKFDEKSAQDTFNVNALCRVSGQLIEIQRLTEVIASIQQVIEGVK